MDIDILLGVEGILYIALLWLYYSRSRQSDSVDIIIKSSNIMDFCYIIMIGLLLVLWILEVLGHC